MSITYINLFNKDTTLKWECSLNTELQLECHAIEIPIQTDIFGSFVYLYINKKEKFCILSGTVLATSFLPIDTNKETFYIDTNNQIKLDKTIYLNGIEYFSITDSANLTHTIPLDGGYKFYINDYASLSNVRFRILEEVDNEIFDNIDNIALGDLDYITIE